MPKDGTKDKPETVQANAVLGTSSAALARLLEYAQHEAALLGHADTATLLDVALKSLTASEPYLVGAPNLVAGKPVRLI